MGTIEEPAAAEATTDDRVSRPRRRGLWALLIALCLGAALILAVIITVSVLNQSRTAADYAKRYFAAVAAGDATTASGMLASDGIPSIDKSFLNDRVLKAASERISDVSVRPANDPLDVFDQKVSVAYTLAGSRHTTTVLLERGEAEWGVLNTWRFRTADVPHVVVNATEQTTYALAGTPIEPGNHNILLFPAVYPLHSGNARYITVEPGELVIDGDGDYPRMKFTATAALQADVQREVRALIDRCAAALTDSAPTVTDVNTHVCGLSVVLPDTATAKGTWRVLGYPTIDVLPGGTTYVTRGGRAAFTRADGGGTTETLRGVELVGAIKFVENGIQLVPDGR